MYAKATYDDIEMDLVHYLRRKLPDATKPWGADLLVSNARVDLDTAAAWSVLVRDDGGRSTSMVTRHHSIATTIIGPADGSDLEGLATRDLAELVMLAIAEAPLDPGTVVADVPEQLGPYRIVHGNGIRPARYATHEVVAAGRSPR